jgi:hypothetical protein
VKKRSGSLSQSLLDLNALVASLKLVVIVGVNVLLIFGKENQTGDRSLFLFCLCVSELWCLVELENVGNALAEWANIFPIFLLVSLLESDKEPNKINESPLEAKLIRLLKVLDDIKPQVDRFRLIEVLTSKSERTWRGIILSYGGFTLFGFIVECFVERIAY